MSEFIFPTDDASAAYCLTIARKMMIFFGIPEGDAIARINEQWKDVAFVGDDLIYHETTDHWAKWIFFGKSYWYHVDESTSASLSRLERKVNSILDHLGLEYRDTSDQVQHLIRTGQKLQAIIIYREETGLELSKAKQTVERIEAQLRTLEAEGHQENKP